MLAELQAAVVQSWQDLIPAAAGWGQASRERARAASESAIAALLDVFEQGDLDDRRWAEVRDVVLAHGHASPEEASELLRAVRIVGVELLGDLLEVSHAERWQLQQQAAAFAATLVGEEDELDAGAIDRLLEELERSGPV